jgi:membrane fusion protein, heavy metal efflux system
MKSRGRNGTFCAALLLLASLGCRGGAKTPEDPPDKQSNAGGEPATLTSTKSFTLDDKMMANISTEEVRSQELPMLLTTTGKVQFNEDRIARVLAPASGQVLSLNVKVGDPVKKGQTLFYINSREAAAAITEELESHKDLQLAEKTQAMTLDLFQHQAASLMALRQAESDLAKARAHVARSEESLRVLGVDVDGSERSERLDSRIPVRSPLGGTVIERRVTEGQFVQPDSNPLLVVADLSTVWVLADIFEHDLHLVSLGQKAEVSTVAYPDKRFMARVSRISDSLDPTTHTAKVRFLADNPTGQLKPEMFAGVTLILSQATRVLTVPATAVFVEGERNYVFVLQSDHHLTRRPVEVVPDPSGRTRVVGGLQAGDRVVSDGALLLHLEESKRESS